MARKLKRIGYVYVDTVFDDDFIYDVYMNHNGDKKYIIIGTR